MASKERSIEAQANMTRCTHRKGDTSMISRLIAISIILPAALAPLALAQPVDKRPMQMYFGDWRASAARATHGSLQERDILTRGDALNPAQKGAVLRFVNSYSHATLAPQTSTKPTRLDGQQEVFFIVSGRGTVTAGGDTADLNRNIVVLMPANLDFTIRNTGSDPLTMYLINEPIPTGFRPNPNMLVRDENKLAIASSDSEWSQIVKPLFVAADGLGTLESVSTVVQVAQTISRPHVARVDSEEVWTGLEGTSIAWLDEALLTHEPGVAFLVRPNDMTPHSNINFRAEGLVKWLVFARLGDHEPRK